MALLQTNKDLIATGMKEFNILLNQQVFSGPVVPEEDMVTVVNDWVNFYISYYRQQMVGEQQEQDKAVQELRQELNTLSASFLDKYRNFLKSLANSVLDIEHDLHPEAYPNSDTDAMWSPILLIIITLTWNPSLMLTLIIAQPDSDINLTLAYNLS
ncbi:alpha-hemoglobin-stabilizing protein [Phocoena phocoena]